MNVFYEEAGSFKVGSILTDNTTSLQIEAVHGKRSKIKTSSVLFRFDTPPLAEFMGQVQKVIDELDPNFLWECCAQNTEFASDELAADYFGHKPTAIEAAAILLLLQNAPIYFYKKGLGRYKAAPPDALKAALAGQEKKRLQAEQQSRYIAQLNEFLLPEEFKPLIGHLLYKPEKNSIEWKALETVCSEKKLTVVKLMEKCGAIPSTHDFHFNQFIWEHFPEGTGFKGLESSPTFANLPDLPTSDVIAFSIDDASTTEIDDAFSVTPLSLGSFRIGIHIAAPALGIEPESALDKIAAARLSTVYLPGNKITMLPDSIINHFTLTENRLQPALSLYLDVADDFTVIKCESRIEKIRVATNLRNNLLEQHFNDLTLNKGDFEHTYSNELSLLWKFACKMEAQRGKTNDNNDKIDYNFEIKDDRVTISERRRGSPIDKVVSELMIYVNTEWGKQLTEASITGIFRSQSNGKVKMSTSPAPHQGLGVSQYTWSSSPMRRYVDLINQRQIIALLTKEAPPYQKDSHSLLVAMRDFDAAYNIYGEFQRAMERYWCLRWLLQENIQITNAQVIKENMVKLDRIPLTTRVPSLPDLAPGSYVKLKISEIDLLDRHLHAEFLQKNEP
ncbi:RNB domain-containing ribonuclease [Nitrosomonas sp. JL21]|uniref:ribonuclease catalytic domain-containing protein n=1 Tax=Nitrosomonas sp. JL21 TaxID=153949 RepID=UPI00137224E1|nr:ribonuclease catalytic domain-containing protein [Nitrosomonas sp. JL21]MBL8498738.1 RNB domain-containing ribonuclease [Nitrosomonas sp.]MXS77427.1 RNB domain-containing ribonuclease [Nitrosomonas sp. JL21]